jgi:hypothetical protein
MHLQFSYDKFGLVYKNVLIKLLPSCGNENLMKKLINLEIPLRKISYLAGIRTSVIARQRQQNKVSDVASGTNKLINKV